MGRFLLVVGALALTVPAVADDPEPSAHWAFKPVDRPAAPAVKNAAWAVDDLDRFILARLESAGLAPAPAADRRVLLRRVSFALTGLPPAPEVLDSETTLEEYVDTLLASPEFGDHWARHWLDHVRYKPFPGRGLANDPYRLWVVKAFNEDLPYDRFLKMQIAGDLMPSPKPDEEVHLDGMVAVRPFSLKKRHEDQVDLLGRTFMGLSLACAECHDHKHEPLSRTDYYALRGLFESSQVVKAPFIRDRARFLEYMGELETMKKNETRMKKELKDFARVSQLMDLRDRIEGEKEKLDNPKEEKNRKKIEANIRKLEADVRKRMEEIEKRKLALDDPKALEYIRLKKWNGDFEKKWKDVYQFDAFVDQSDPKRIADAAPPKEGVKVKPGNEPEREPPVPRRFPVVLAGRDQAPLGEVTKQSGRLQLAEWLAAPDHPITARLMINRTWYYLFGEGLTPSLSNFGHSGVAPTHPALLDRLADDFVKSGWSMKTLVRRIVLSSTWRQASTIEADRDERDRRLALFGLARVRRLESESIWRTLGALAHDPKSGSDRRGPPVDLVQEMDGLFDGADSSLIVPRRSASVSSLQALFFMNSDHVRASTEKIALRLHASDAPDDAARIRLAFRLLYGRDATDGEVAAGGSFLREWAFDPRNENRKKAKNAPPPEVLGKWQAYLQALVTANEFLFLD